MGLKEQIVNDIKSAMKAKNQPKVDALRFVNAAIKNREIELGPNLISDAEVTSVIKKLSKQRMDSIEQYQKANRDDLVKKEQYELELLRQYLPEQLSKEQIETMVKEVITALGAKSIKDMGSVMKEAGARAKGRADNKLMSEVVRSLLQ